ncbi:MAG: hypothetical protein Q9159_002002 [Coniocarpon cinnabarinum]
MSIGVRGQRLLGPTIDAIARDDTSRVWAVKPHDDAHLSKGFREVTFRELADAIDRASWWLQDVLPEPKEPFEVFAYLGPNDTRILLLVMAATKGRRKVRRPEIQAGTASIDNGTDVVAITNVVERRSRTPLDTSALGMRDVVVPELDAWLAGGPVQPFPYIQSWDEAESDPCLIFHSSGTTGLPKPITYTNFMMTSMDAALLIHEQRGGQAIHKCCTGKWFTGVPMFHFVGVTIALQWPAFLGNVFILPPPGPPNPTVTGDSIEYAGAMGAVLQPALIEGLAQTEHGTQQLLKLKQLQFCGAPLRGALGDKLAQQVYTYAAIGTTEAGGYLREERDDRSEWEYMRFSRENGIVFERFSNDIDLYEMVFHRQSEYERWQQIFKVYPDALTYRTKDLYARHPTKEGLWKFAGRADDLFKLSSGYGVNAARIEEQLLGSGRIDAAVVGGSGRLKPFAIVSLRDQTAESGSNDAALSDEVWQDVQNVNEDISDIAKFSKERIIIASPKKPFEKTGKGTVSRARTVERYRDEIEAAFRRVDE